MIQKDIQTDLTKPDPIGMGSYNSDSHNIQRIVNDDGFVRNEGDMQVAVKPYQIPYRVMLPKRREAQNLLVPVCFSATHVAYCTLRMEPQYMILGQAAGVAATMAIRRQLPVQDIDTAQLTGILKQQGAIMEYVPNAVTPILQIIRHPGDPVPCSASPWPTSGPRPPPKTPSCSPAKPSPTPPPQAPASSASPSATSPAIAASASPVPPPDAAFLDRAWAAVAAAAAKARSPSSSAPSARRRRSSASRALVVDPDGSSLRLPGQGAARPLRRRHLRARHRAARLSGRPAHLRRRHLPRRLALSRDRPLGRPPRRAGRLPPALPRGRAGRLSADDASPTRPTPSTRRPPSAAPPRTPASSPPSTAPVDGSPTTSAVARPDGTLLC